VGAQHPRDVVGLVALSAERRVTSNPSDLLAVGRRVRVPVLSVGSRHARGRARRITRRG
jgi:hypothetical protein